METTSTTQPLMLKKILSLIVFILVYSNSLFASPTTYASVGDFVWKDLNGNGKQDSGEPGVAGVTVKLINSAGNAVATTTTNSSGKYLFSNVSVPSCGQYRVQFGTPGQYTWTTKQAPGTTVTNNSNADANGLSDAFTLCPGDINPCLDAGIRQSSAGKATIGDFVWKDLNANGKQDAGEPGVSGVVVKLINAAGSVVATATTNSSGIYMFVDVPVSACGQYRVQFGTPGQYTWTTKQASGTTATDNSNADANGLTDEFTVCPGDYNMCIDAGIRQSSSGKATVGDFVWIDQNANGRQDAGEPGVSGVVVKLINAAGTVVATATTNSSGIYMFVDVPVSACGQYRVQFGTPGQYRWTTKQAAGTTATDNSNADANGLTDEFTVCPGDYNMCIDAGLLPSATIGDFVWDDEKIRNGKQDAGEPGIPNITVQLYNSAGTVVATTTTNASGYYMFTIAPGSCTQYRIKFSAGSGPVVFVQKHAPGTTTSNDSDADATGFTDFFTVCPGTSNLTIDAGICSSCALPITLAQFQGAYSNGIAKLTWSTSLETGRTTYDIERSADGINFTSLSIVNGRGNTSGSSYTFNDNLPLSGNNYYRLKIYDGNTYQYSKIVLLNVAIKGITIKMISGNPFLNQVRLNVVSENQVTIRVMLTDPIGRVLKTQLVQGQKGSNEILINDLGSLTKGMYNLQVNTGGESKSIKLMKD